VRKLLLEAPDLLHKIETEVKTALGITASAPEISAIDDADEDSGKSKKGK